MKIKPIDDNNSDFNKVILRKTKIYPYLHPICKEHGAMLRVSKEGLYRCILAKSLKTGKCVKDCRAGCILIED